MPCEATPHNILESMLCNRAGTIWPLSSTTWKKKKKRISHFIRPVVRYLARLPIYILTRMCSKLLFAPPTHNIINNIMNQTIVQFYPDATKSLIALTNALLISAAARTKKPFYLALSGGETARSLFEIWKTQYNDLFWWKNVHFF